MSISHIAISGYGTSSTIFKVFGMMLPGIEPRSPGSLANTLPTGQWVYINNHIYSNNHNFIAIFYSNNQFYSYDYDFIVSKIGNLSQGWPEGSIFNSYYMKV